MSRLALLACALACALPSTARAQASDPTPHPDITIHGDGSGQGGSTNPRPPESLTSPSIDVRRAELSETPGSVEVIDADSYKRSTPAVTIKDVLDYTPGVFAQTKWGEDTRLSIRGSGLSRNFHLRGVQLYMDGIPINTADGFGDFQEIDPSAYRLIEVYKGANALRFGANALGGAVNFVTPTGRDLDASVAQGGIDVGAFGFYRLQASSGGAHGKADYFVTGAWQQFDGFRDHSSGRSARFSGNVGYQFSENVETRFYLNANDVDQNIPGGVTRRVALHDPRKAAQQNVDNDWERNINSLRFANKTTFRLADTTSVDVGVFAVDRHLRHPIYQWLDYKYVDYGAFARATDERSIAGHANRLVVGVNLHNGENDAKQYVNAGGEKDGKRFDAEQTSNNVSAYAENTFYLAPAVGLVAGLQFLHAKRDQDVRYGGVSGKETFNLASPKFGVLWHIDPTWQAFANVSRSVEVPSFGENGFGGVNGLAKAQKAWTYEVGTRARREDVAWDVAIYRMEIRDELQCITLFPGFCSVGNAKRTVHQGVELGFGAAILKGLAVKGDVKDGGYDSIWLNLAYTFSDFYFKKHAVDGESVKGNELPGAPRHYVRAELLYKHPIGFFAGPNVEWIPEAYYVDNANTTKTKAYALLGLKAGYDAGRGFSAYVEGRNLLDKKYISTVSIIDDVRGADLPLYEPGVGRAVYAGVKYRW